MRRVILIFTISVFLFSGLIQGPFSPLKNVINLVDDFDKVAWAKDKPKDKDKDKDKGGPTPTPEPSTLILIGTGIAGAALLRKKFKK